MSKVFIISAPSGCGKTTICKEILKKFPELSYSISYTTRSPRKGEVNGKDYNFISIEEFENGIKQNKWAEWAKVHDNYYATSAFYINENISQNISTLLDIDVLGTNQILIKYPDAITIFIMPPSIEVLKKRLIKRGTDSDQVIEKRLLNAQKEIEQKHIYKHIVVNDILDQAINDVSNIIKEGLKA